MKHFKYRSHIFLMFCFLFFTVLLIFPETVSAALKTSELETVPWNMVTESSIINEKGWLQSMCATDQYIVCLVNASKKTTEPDTLIAFYRNNTDADGNPVEQYSYAFSVTETDYEHGNGMTYNPNTQEIAIAGLFTNDPSNAGAVFIVDANTLHFKRKVRVGNGSINFFGIDYVPEKDQYVLMANRIADYAFYFTDSNFEIVDKLNLHLSYSRSSFQDFCVSGDSIISIPYMQREGYMNVLDVYSISQQKRVGSYYLTLPGHDAFEVEPEGICQLEPGHLLMASAIIGTTRFRLYEATLPLVHSVTPARKTEKSPTVIWKLMRAIPAPSPTHVMTITDSSLLSWTERKWISASTRSPIPLQMSRKTIRFRLSLKRSRYTPSLLPLPTVRSKPPPPGKSTTP